MSDSERVQATDSTPKQAAAVATTQEQRERLQAAYQQAAAEYGHAKFQLEGLQDQVRDLKRRLMQFNVEFARLDAVERGRHV